MSADTCPACDEPLQDGDCPDCGREVIQVDTRGE